MIWPDGVIFPIAFVVPASVNHRFPSSPATIACGALPGFSPTVNSVIWPEGVIRPIAPMSTNHTLPSGPGVSELGLLGLGSPVENSVIGAAPAAADPVAVISSTSISTRTARMSVRPQSTVRGQR